MNRRFHRRGAAGQQYAIIVGLVAVLAIIAVTQLGSGVRTLMTGVSNRLDGAANGSTAGGGPWGAAA